MFLNFKYQRNKLSCFHLVFPACFTIEMHSFFICTKVKFTESEQIQSLKMMRFGKCIRTLHQHLYQDKTFPLLIKFPLCSLQSIPPTSTGYHCTDFYHRLVLPALEPWKMQSYHRLAFLADLFCST